ncbi:MAG TPA: SLC13 family permease, partial [Planctomycetota bacterium]|nr:SLC13 family permease [Planctomycetota bacterium]
PALAFVLAAVVMVGTGLLSLHEAYQSIDWPVIVLLAAMLPVGAALETTGGAALLASMTLKLGQELPSGATMLVLMVITMLLSNVINNAAAAVLMAPIALSVADGLNASTDPFLMAVAIGASCAFLTPIGHQSNTLVLSPGGYRFGDFWRAGAPLSALVLGMAVLLLLRFWPL